jgi:MinD-like ATPase involved in chromosome partitioning or flagellar assembly/CheY-like chemotaxis protein
MDKGTLILLVDESAAGIDSIRRVLADRAHHFRVQRVEDVPTALARILGGGVDIVLLNLPAAQSPENERLLPFLDLRNQTQAVPLLVPIVVLCGSADESLAEAAIHEGAADYLIREAYDSDLLRVLRSVASKTALSPAPLGSRAVSGRGGRVLVFMGSKGGAGTTTVALNVAAALAENYRVILADFHPEVGTLAQYFQPHRSVPDLGDLLRSETNLESCLWPSKTIPGLQILFGPRDLDASPGLNPANVLAALADLAQAADYVVVDAPSSLSAVNRAVIEDAALLTLVVERDSLAVDSGRLLLRAIDSWKAGRVSLGAVIVNRAALVSPIPLADIEIQLAAPILGVIPPAADVCAAAQHAHTPLLELDGDNLPSIALRALSRVIAHQIPLRSNILGAPSPALAPGLGLHRVGIR